MPNGKGNIECHYCIHYRNKWQDRPEFDEVGKEISAYAKRIEMESEDNEARRQELTAVWDFFDFLCAGGEEGESCDFHNVKLPKVPENRFCINFSPTEKFYRHRPEWSAESQVSDTFPEHHKVLQSGVLYGFFYYRSEVWKIRVIG